MRFLLCVLLLAPTNAFAADTMSIGEQAARCWNIPAGLNEMPPAVAFDVKFGDTGQVLDMAVVEPELDRELVLSAARAIEMCAPYSDTPAGVARVTLRLNEGPAIDPFKPLE